MTHADTFVAVANVARRLDCSTRTVERDAARLGIAIYRRAGGRKMIRAEDEHRLVAPATPSAPVVRAVPLAPPVIDYRAQRRAMCR